MPGEAVIAVGARLAGAVPGAFETRIGEAK
jgi:hypothetical protein